MPFAVYGPNGSIRNVPAAVNDDGRALPIGYDDIEGVTKIAMMVWNPDLLTWERGTSVGGGGGGGGGAATYTKRVDTVSAALMYVGSAAVGTSESASGWLVQKISFDGSGSVTSVLIGVGVWSDRAALSYS